MTKESYNCESRPYMTILLVVSILVLLFLRKSSIIKVKKVNCYLKKKELLETNTVFSELCLISSREIITRKSNRRRRRINATCGMFIRVLKQFQKTNLS